MLPFACLDEWIWAQQPPQCGHRWQKRTKGLQSCRLSIPTASSYLSLSLLLSIMNSRWFSPSSLSLLLSSFSFHYMPKAVFLQSLPLLSLSLDVWLWASYSTATQDYPLLNSSSSGPLPAVRSSLPIRPSLSPSILATSQSLAIFQPHMLYLFQTGISLHLASFQLPIIMLMDRASDWEKEGGREVGNEGSTFSLYLSFYLFLSFTSMAKTLTASVKLNKLMRMPTVLKGHCEFIKQQ